MEHQIAHNLGDALINKELLDAFETAKENFFKELDVIKEKFGDSNNVKSIQILNSYTTGIIFVLNQKYPKCDYRFTYDSSHLDRSTENSS